MEIGSLKPIVFSIALPSKFAIELQRIVLKTLEMFKPI